jgi:hypothetical protein
MEKLINIKVESKILTLNETIPEKKVIKRLTDIREVWSRRNLSTGSFDKLKVTTSVFNPTLL